MNHDSDRCFRFGRDLLYIGVACTVFFGLSSIGWSAAAFWNLGGSFKHPLQAALFFGAFWAGWTILGVWLIFTYVRSRRYISPQGVRELGVFRVRTVRFDGLLAAQWRLLFRGGSLVLRGEDGKLTLYFDSFSRADQREMIELLRNRIDQHIQQGWEPFESRILTRLIQTLEAGQTQP